MKKSIYDPLGSLTYSPKAIQKIVAMRLADMDGVLAVDKNIIQKFSNKLTSTDYKGITIEVSDAQIAIDVNVVIKYGESVPKIYNYVSSIVKEEIFAMTGLTLVEFNINVEDILAVEEYEEIIRRETKANNLLNEKIIEKQPEFFTQGKEKTVTEKMKDAISGVGDSIAEKAQETKVEAGKMLHTASEKTAELANNAKEKAISLGETAKEKAIDLGNVTKEKMTETKDAVIDITDQTKADAQELVAEAAEKIESSKEKAKDTAADVNRKIKEEKNKTVEKADKLVKKADKKIKKAAKTKPKK